MLQAQLNYTAINASQAMPRLRDECSLCALIEDTVVYAQEQCVLVHCEREHRGAALLAEHAI